MSVQFQPGDVLEFETPGETHVYVINKTGFAYESTTWAGWGHAVPALLDRYGYPVRVNGASGETPAPDSVPRHTFDAILTSLAAVKAERLEADREIARLRGLLLDIHLTSAER